MDISVTRSRISSAMGSSLAISIIRFSIPRMYQEVSQMVHCMLPTDAMPRLCSACTRPARPPLFFSE